MSDPAHELAEIDAAIDRVVDEHQTATGHPRFHVGHCDRIDLHRQLVALHARKQQLTAQIAKGERRSEKLLRVLRSLARPDDRGAA
jgi:hypothetical protein